MKRMSQVRISPPHILCGLSKKKKNNNNKLASDRSSHTIYFENRRPRATLQKQEQKNKKKTHAPTAGNFLDLAVLFESDTQ
jgi:hypothetical protein